MRDTWTVLILALIHFSFTVQTQTCPDGFNIDNGLCDDINECEDYPGLCGKNANCFNTNGSYYCQCKEGFKSKLDTFIAKDSVTCDVINECVDNPDICGPNASCENTMSSYTCSCKNGFVSSTGVKIFHDSDKVTCRDIDECDGSEKCGENAKCFNTDGSYYCHCKEGFRSKTVNFTPIDFITCRDIDECVEIKDICGPNAFCKNIMSSYTCSCINGFVSSTGVKIFHGSDKVTCRDVDECTEICRENTNCLNTDGSYYCQCTEGFRSSAKTVNFTAKDSAKCKNTDECKDENVCGLNAACINTQGSYYCICNAGYALKSGNSSFSGQEEQCEDICKIDETICGNGSCLHEASGHYCACSAGFSNYGNKTARCTELRCGVFKDVNNLMEKFDIVKNDMKELSESCLNLSGSKDSKELNGEVLLKSLLSLIDQLLSAGSLNDNKKISTFLDVVEQALRFIGPFIKTPGTKTSTNHTELELLVHTGSAIPQGLKTLLSTHAKVDIKMKEAAGDPSSYPGFTTVSLLSYSNLENSTEGFYSGMKKNESQDFKLNSKVVTVSVSNTDTKHLNEPVNITLYHLEQSNQTAHTCVFWDSSKEGGAWSDRGCNVAESNPKYTVCSCNHLSSFAVLMALYDIESPFELQLISWIGLSLSLICLFLCILTFSMIRSIKSPRTTIHLHLCISLFIATLVFLAGISQTQNKVGCAVVAGMLHFFYLASFCWMCLEGIQLFRMVVLVFNTNFKTTYMMAGGYGVPAVIVAVTALVNRDGYGTKKYCWINLDSIWSFYGPVCVIITVNVFFFLVTVWKLAQKFSSLNPDLDSLHKIKAFTVTAVAQLCILGIMWIFGCFQFEKDTIAMSYLFTIFGSLQGVMLFVMHCLFSKQVREEYENILSQLRAPRKRTYSEFNHSSKANASRSSQDTGESHMI